MKWIIGLLILATLALVLLLVAARIVGPQHPLGSTTEPLSPCPESPNCVCSLDPAHPTAGIEPIAFSGSANAALSRLSALIEQYGGQIERQETGYLHATFRSALIGYRDDLELRVDSERSVIEVRSSSRIGHSDFGVNRQRVQVLRQAFAEQ